MWLGKNHLILTVDVNKRNENMAYQNNAQKSKCINAAFKVSHKFRKDYYHKALINSHKSVIKLKTFLNS